MTARLDAMAHFHQTARGVLGTTQCFPSVQPNHVFPAVVFYAVGQNQVSTLAAGPHQRATAIRFEVRSRSYAESVRLSAAIVEALRSGRRLLSLLSLVENFNDELGIYRRIRSVMVR